MKQPSPLLISRKLIRSIRMTRTGWAFILLTIGLGFAGLNTGNNLLYLIFGMFISMLLINGILSSSSIFHLLFQLTLPSRIYVGKDNPLKIDITNKKVRFPSYAITVTPKIKATKQQPATNVSSYFMFKIAPQEKHSFVHYYNFLKRGRQPLNGFRLHTSYPFGLIEKFIPIEWTTTVVVYPKLIPMHKEMISSTAFRGDYLSGKRGIGVNPYGVRDFHHGDDIRHLHWRSFAKVGKWMIKEFEEEKKSKITLHLITEKRRPQAPHAVEKREALVSLTASLLMHFIEESREVALMLNHEVLQPAGTRYVDFYLTALALFDSAPREEWATTTKASTHNLGKIIAISETGEIPAGQLPIDNTLLDLNQPDNLEQAAQP